MTLADELKRRGCETRFISAALPDGLQARLAEAGHELARIAPHPELRREGLDWEEQALSQGAQHQDASATADALGGAVDWLVVDHYLLARTWQEAVRPHVRRLAVLDDFANRWHAADLLLDQTPGREPADYSRLVGGVARLLLGPLYALLRPEFHRERPRSLARRQEAVAVRSILISLGASDVGGYTLPAARAALAAVRYASVEVVIGGSADSLKALQALAAENPRVRLHVDTERMAPLMREADLAVGAAGSTSWERCCLGLPTVALILAENQREVARQLMKVGATWIGEPSNLQDLIAALAHDGRERLGMSAAAAALVDGKGTARAVDLMLDHGGTRSEGAIDILPAAPEHSQMLWLWRNDPATRHFSKDGAAITWPDHAAWFERALGSDTRHLFIAERGGVSVGMVRFDQLEWGRAHEVSINVAPGSRGRGTGRAVLAAACRHWQNQWGEARLEAAVHESNVGSRRIFEAAGFVCAYAADGDGYRRYVRNIEEPGWQA